MARKKPDDKADAKPDTVTDAAADSAADNDEPLDTVDDLLEELESHADSAVCIKKILDTNELADCFSVAPQELTWPQLIDRIRMEFGAGKYWALGRVGTKWRGRKKIIIATARNAMPPTIAAATAVESNRDRERADKLETLQTQIMLALISKPTPPAQANRMPEILASAGAVLTGLGTVAVPLLKKMMEGKDLTEEILKAKKLMDTFGKDAGGSNENDVFIALAKSAEKLIDHLPALTGGAASPKPKPTAAVKPAEAAKQIAAPLTPMQTLMKFLSARLPHLVECAQDGADPEITAMALVDRLSCKHPDLPPLAAQIVKNPGLIAQLAVAAPPVNEHQAWFESLRAALIVTLDPPADPASPAMPAPAPAEGAREPAAPAAA